MALATPKVFSKSDFNSMLLRNEKVRLIDINEPAIRSSFSHLFVKDDEAVLRKYFSHWQEIYNAIPDHILEIRGFVFEGKKFVGAIADSNGAISLEKLILSKERISGKNSEENKVMLARQLIHLVQALHDSRWNLYHGNIALENISVRFAGGLATFKFGAPSYADNEKTKREFVEDDKKQIERVTNLIKIEDLQERKEFALEILRA